MFAPVLLAALVGGCATVPTGGARTEQVSRSPQVQQAHAPIGGAVAAHHQATGFQAVDHAAERGRVKADATCQRALVETRLTVDGGQGRELNGRDAEVLRFLQKDGHGDLLQAADVEAGQFFERLGINRCRGERHGQKNNK